jgi:hypothetical protein
MNHKEYVESYAKWQKEFGEAHKNLPTKPEMPFVKSKSGITRAVVNEGGDNGITIFPTISPGRGIDIPKEDALDLAHWIIQYYA